MNQSELDPEATRLLARDDEEYRQELLQEGASLKIVDMLLTIKRHNAEVNQRLSTIDKRFHQMEENQTNDEIQRSDQNDNKGNEEENNEKKLSSDSYSLMIVSETWSLPWFFGFSTWLFQISMYVLLLNDQLLQEMVYAISDDPRKILFGFPPVVSPFVSCAQVFALLVTNLMQDDVFIAAKSFVVLYDTTLWHGLRGSVYQVDAARQKSLWWYRVVLPLLLKFSQGLFGIFVTMVVILQNYTIMGLFKDFTALVFIGQIDELVFSLALLDHFGRKIRVAAHKVDSVTIPTNSHQRTKLCGVPMYRQAQWWSLCFLFAFWGFVTYQQRSGRYIKTKYPNCRFEPDDFQEWFKLGNNDCETKYNNPACGFDGEDCLDFNRRYPYCQADHPFQVGDGECHSGIYNTTQCRFDGYDCFDEWFDESCIVPDVEWLGDGNCNSGSYNTPECGFDGGDCIDFNDKYPDCKVEKPYLVGNGICNHDNLLNEAQRGNFHFIKVVMNNSSQYMSRHCGFDGGDCLGYLFPNCGVSRLDYLNDGFCNTNEEYNREKCGFDGGDCVDFNFKYPDCTVDYEPFLRDGVCIPAVTSLSSASCNFGGEDRCFDRTKFPECNSTSPPLMSRGYCRPECGHDNKNNNCTYFEDKYPQCNATDLSLIGNGVCDNSVYNIAECGYEDYDCVEVTVNCGVDNPEWIGDGVCHAGISSSYNTSDCGYDGGDCVEANVMGRSYNCNVEIPSALRNGYCNGLEYNTEVCGFDGGDCIEANEKYSLLYPEFRVQFPNCSVVDPVLLFDDFCQVDWIFSDLNSTWYNILSAYNTTECGYDNGACV